MKNIRGSKLIVVLICLVTCVVTLSATAEDAKPPPAQHLTVAVGNRLYPDFHETHPHFARIDSTKQIISLSEEPENVAFKFVVYENDSIVDTSWSFFSLKVPHFARTSYLYFNVLQFDYRGKTFDQRSEGQSQ